MTTPKFATMDALNTLMRKAFDHAEKHHIDITTDTVISVQHFDNGVLVGMVDGTGRKRTIRTYVLPDSQFYEGDKLTGLPNIYYSPEELAAKRDDDSPKITDLTVDFDLKANWFKRQFNKLRSGHQFKKLGLTKKTK